MKLKIVMTSLIVIFFVFSVYSSDVDLNRNLSLMSIGLVNPQLELETSTTIPSVRLVNPQLELETSTTVPSISLVSRQLELETSSAPCLELVGPQLEHQTSSKVPSSETDLDSSRSASNAANAMLNVKSKDGCPVEHINITQAPYIVAIQIRGQGKPAICSGFFIRNSWILTSAQCFDDAKIHETFVIIGANVYNDSSAYTLRPVKVILHNHYIRRDKSGKTFNDIALIQVDVPEEVLKHVAILEVDENEWLPINRPRECQAIGYGIRRTQLSVDRRLHVNYFTASHDHDGCGCHTSNRLYICGRIERNVAQYFGDSGGPLLCGGLAVGLANLVLECKISGSAKVAGNRAVYHRYLYLCAYFDWISLLIKDFSRTCKSKKSFVVLISRSSNLQPTADFSIMLCVIFVTMVIYKKGF
uniref:Putative trypsin panstrongylus lignarius n=1 Tax=Rhodnius prolixus TaxID=13249 RepID=A0A4V0Y8L1_RHOPR